jgi:cyclophilin family peptidyl-prolyl cis-trans isomerase
MMRNLSTLNRCLFGFLVIASFSVMAGPQVLVKTTLGEIVIDLNDERAPITVANFLSYVDAASYDNTIFHRVIPSFMVQGGGFDPNFVEAVEGESIRNEADNGLKNKRGTIAMARMNQTDSADRQFFINVKSNSSLNHSKRSCTREQEAAVAAALSRGIRKPTSCKSFGYAVFGKVTSGMDIVDLIEEVETHTVGHYNDVPITPIVILSIKRVVVEETADALMLDSQ